MSPRLAHRRSRRRSRSGRLVVVVIAAVAIALLVGGIARVGHQSGPYDASVNRSFAVQGTLITEESNATASSLRQLWRTMQNPVSYTHLCSWTVWEISRMI